MRKILIALLCLVSCSVFGQRITDKLERVGFLELRANGPLHLPEDTVLSTSVNANVCQQIAKKNGVVYTYDCFMEYWRPIAPENTLDSARRSNDTLYFRTFAGTEFAVKMDYYDKGQADARYKPIGYVPAWVEITDKPTTFPPSAHQHPISDVTGLQGALDSKIPVAEKAAANGVATLGSNGKIPSNQIPALAISETFVVASQAAMLALTAETGDVAVRTDLSQSFILAAEPPSTLSNWQELLTPTAPVQSVNGQTGNVSLTKADVGLGNVDNTSDLNKPISTATQTALNGKEPTIGGGLPTQYWTGSKAWADFTQSARDAFSAGSGISISNGVITNTAPAPATPSWQQTLSVNNIATITPAVVNAPPLDAGLYAVGQYELRSSTYPSIGFHRPGNAGMALYLGDIDQADLRIRTSSNTDYKLWHDGYAPVTTPTLQQVTTAGNTTNQTVVIGNHTFGTSRVLINNAADDGANPLQVSGNGVFKSAGGTVVLELGREVGLNAFTSGNNGFAAWQPLALLSGGLLVSNRAGARPTDDAVSSLQINGAVRTNTWFQAREIGSGYSILSSGNPTAAGWFGIYKPDNTRLGYIGSGSNNMDYVAENGANHKFYGAHLQVHKDTDYGTNTWSDAQIIASGNSNRDKKLAMGYSVVNDFGFIQAGEEGIAYKNLLLNPSAGLVGIGTTSPATLLDVNGTITAPALTSPSGNDLSLSAPSGHSLFFNPGGVNRGVWDADGRLGIGQTPSSIRGSMLEINGNVWSTDAYILGSGSTPIGEFGLDGNVFLRSMGAQNINFLTHNSTQRAQINATSGNFILENQIQIKGGSPGAGKVLTSDGAGVATWESPATGNYVNLNAADFTAPQTGYIYVTGNIRTQAQVNSAGIISTNGISSTTSANAQISITNSTAGVSAGIFVGTGSPENVVNAQPGSLFLSSSGTLYVKTSGTGNTGWVAK